RSPPVRGFLAQWVLNAGRGGKGWEGGRLRLIGGGRAGWPHPVGGAKRRCSLHRPRGGPESRPRGSRRRDRASARRPSAAAQASANRLNEDGLVIKPRRGQPPLITASLTAGPSGLRAGWSLPVWLSS